jgi:hypothetical protein
MYRDICRAEPREGNSEELAMNVQNEVSLTTHIRESDSSIVLHPENQDLFTRTGKQIIAACQMDISVQVWLDELQSMFAEVSEWCTRRADKIKCCLAQGRGAKVLLLFVPLSEKFDFALATELAVLNRELVTHLNIGMVELGQIPDSDISRFLEVERTKIIYGKSPQASEPVAAQS